MPADSDNMASLSKASILLIVFMCATLLSVCLAVGILYYKRYVAQRSEREAAAAVARANAQLEADLFEAEARRVEVDRGYTLAVLEGWVPERHLTGRGLAH